MTGTNHMYDNSHTPPYTGSDEIDIHPHALRTHRITRQQIETAFVTRVGPARIRGRDSQSDPRRWATIGFDDRLRAIELVYIETSDHQPLVIHANYLTKGFYEEWRQA